MRGLIFGALCFWSFTALAGLFTCEPSFLEFLAKEDSRANRIGMTIKRKMYAESLGRQFPLANTLGNAYLERGIRQALAVRRFNLDNERFLASSKLRVIPHYVYVTSYPETTDGTDVIFSVFGDIIHDRPSGQSFAEPFVLAMQAPTAARANPKITVKNFIVGTVAEGLLDQMMDFKSNLRDSLEHSPLLDLFKRAQDLR